MCYELSVHYIKFDILINRANKAKTYRTLPHIIQNGKYTSANTLSVSTQNSHLHVTDINFSRKEVSDTNASVILRQYSITKR